MKIRNSKSCVALWGVMLWALVATIGMIGQPIHLKADDDNAQRAFQSSTRWRVQEQGWTGEWVRRPGTNTFDARWNTPGQAEIRGVIDMDWNGRNLRMTRTDLYSNQRCEYRGEISRDGRTAHGWQSCNNGPRVDWSAEIFYDTRPIPDRRDDHAPPPSSFGRPDRPIVPRYNDNLNNWRYDLTGIWQCDDGGTYYVRQLGNNVWWYGESSNGQWSNIFHGALDGERLEGLWLDVPKGRDLSHGALRLQVDSLNEFHRVDKSGDDFGGSRWRRVR